MQTLNILNIIMEKTKYVSTSTSVLFVAQVLLSSYVQVIFYYNIIKSCNILLKVIACMLPACLIATWCTISPLTLGSFVSGGLSNEYILYITDTIRTKPFIWELILVAVVYTAAAILYVLVSHPKWHQILSTFGLETIMLIICLFLFIGLHNKQFDLPDKSPLFCTVVSGYFMVIQKTLLTIFSLLGAAVFRERNKTILSLQQKNFFTEKDFELSAVKLLNQHQKLTALTFAVTVTIFVWIPTIGLLWENGLPVSLKNIITVLNIIPGLIWLFIGVLAWACYLLVFAFFPRLSAGYRILQQNHRLFEYFYYEVVQNYSSLPIEKEVSTTHFVVIRSMFFVHIYLK